MDALPEFRIVNPTTLAEAIAARADNPKAMPLGGGMVPANASGGGDGMLSFDQHLAERLRQQVITYEQALELCHSAEEFKRLAGRA